jgi:two-component system phosphate regulon sensor histidine kinase PhoR
VLVCVAALRGTLDAWLLVAACAVVPFAALLSGDPVRDQARRAARASAQERRLALAERLLANIPDPVILVDHRALVVEANDAARALLPALKARHPLSFALRSPDVLDGIEGVIRSGEPLKVEFVERVPTERVYEVQIGPLRLGEDDAAGRAEAGVLLFFRDQTSARRLESMRVDFVANASHELRTPLASLLGFIETLQGSARNDAAARDRFLEIMRQQARRMTRLIDDLLSLSRIELRAHVRPETPVDLSPLVGHMVETLRPLARDGGVAVEYEAPPGPVAVLGDRDELLRVVENLVENAVKYGESGGRVEVRLTRGEDGVELAVRDFGPGIAAEHLPRLTERFYRVDVAHSRQKGGTGLGLAIVKHIVARHGGRIAIESAPGEGALFRVTIPEAPAAAA